MAMNRLVRVLLAGFLLMGAITAYAEPAKETGQDAEKDKPRLVVQTGHTGLVGLGGKVALSKNAKLIFSTGNNVGILWDRATGRQLRSFIAKSPMHYAAFSPDARLVATTGGMVDEGEGSLLLWDVATGKRIRNFEGACFSPVFSPDGKIIAARCSHGEISLFDTESGQFRIKYAAHDIGTSSIIFSSSGHTLVSGGEDKIVKQWDASSGKLLQTFSGHDAKVNAVVISSDEAVIASVSDDKTLRLWNVKSGKEMHTLPHEGRVGTVAFSPNGKLVVSAGCSGCTTVWDVKTGTRVQSDATNSTPSAVVFMPDNKTVLSQSFVINNDRKLMAQLDFWDTSVPRPFLTFDRAEEVHAAAITPNGKMAIFSEGKGRLVGIDSASGKEVFNSSGHTDVIRVIAVSRDGKLMASGSDDNSVRIWNADTGTEIIALPGNSPVVALGFDKGSLVAWYKGGQVRQWNVADWNELSGAAGNRLGDDLSTQREKWGLEYIARCNSPVKWLTVRKVEGGTYAVVNLKTRVEYPIGRFDGDAPFFKFSPDGHRLAIATSGGQGVRLRLWDDKGGLLKTSLSMDDDFRSMAFSLDGRKVALGGGEKISVWDSNDGSLLASADSETAGESEFNSLSFDNHGRTILASAFKGLLVWNYESHDHSYIRGLSGSVSAIALSPDGNRLVSAGVNNFASFDLAAGKLDKNLSGRTISMSNFMSFLQDKKTIVIGSAYVQVWDMEKGKLVKVLRKHKGKIEPEDNVFSLSTSKDGRYVASLHIASSDFERGPYKVKVWDMEQDREIFNAETPGHAHALTISPDGSLVLVDSEKGITYWDISKGGAPKTLPLQYGDNEAQASSMSFSPDGKTLAVGMMYGDIRLFNVSNMREIKTLANYVRNKNGWELANSADGLTFSHDGRLLASANERGHVIHLWNVETGLEVAAMQGHESVLNSLTFSNKSDLLFSGSDDGSVKIWRVSDGKLLASLYSFTDGSWVVTDPEGRFDTSDLEEIKGLHWVMPDDPLTPVPLEAFMKEYYEPRLLARILNGEQFKPVPKLMDKNRVQPEVKLLSVVADPKDAERVNVTVEVSGSRKDYQRDGHAVPMKTAAHDLHLFRDGQLVGYLDGKVVGQGDKPIQKTFSVRLPSHKADQDITFSAYAFNDDRVKSNTVRASYHAPTTLQTHQGRAYVISMGVNRHDNPAWNLRYAANDARLVQQRVADRLGKTGQYQQVIPLALVSDQNEHHAIKGALRGILARLSGKQPTPQDADLFKGIANADQLQTATPDDLILLTFSGHGFADDSGNFYLINQDTGTKDGKTITEALKQHSISSAELSNWLRDVDAGDMTMIVDACQSAASVQGDGFKPGPMGSRGLGQLSFDKGMRILAASQADEYALENDQLKQGLLSFSLVTDGLEAFNADREPKDSRIMLDEWLRYGVDRVPQLAEEVKTGHVHIAKRGGDQRGAVRVSATDGGKSRPAQQPALFDFAKKRRQVEVAAGK